MTGRVPTTIRVLLIAASGLAGSGHGAEHRINAWLEPADQVYLGQQTRLIVHLETDAWFTDAPRYPEIRVPGAVVLKPESFGVNSTRREGTVTWTGQQQRYLIFPQRTGRLRIPPIRITFAMAGEAPLTATTPELQTEVIAPPGTEDLSGFVTTPRLAVREAWDEPPDELVVGDALTRTVTQTAQGTFALLLTPAQFPAPEGITAYPDPPELVDTANRGKYTARRTDSATYILQAAGTRELPALVFHWFDPASRTLHREALPARTLTVAVNPDAQLGSVPEPSLADSVDDLLARGVGWLMRNLLPLTLLATAIWFGHLLWWRLSPGLRKRYRNWKAVRRDGERVYFRRLLAAARQGDPDAFVSAFWAWADRLPGRSGPLTLRKLGLPPELPEPWADFLAARYSVAAPPATLPADAAGSLRRLRRCLRTAAGEKADHLPNLNP